MTTIRAGPRRERESEDSVQRSAIPGTAKILKNPQTLRPPVEALSSRMTHSTPTQG